MNENEPPTINSNGIIDGEIQIGDIIVMHTGEDDVRSEGEVVNIDEHSTYKRYSISTGGTGHVYVVRDKFVFISVNNDAIGWRASDFGTAEGRIEVRRPA